MKSLDVFLKESIEDNLEWKIVKYFERNDSEKKIFDDLLVFCQSKPSFNKNDIKEYLDNHEFKNLKKFVDFLDDVIKIDTTDRDYYYILSIVIKKLIMKNK